MGETANINGPVDPPTQPAADPAAARLRSVKWDDSRMSSSFANVVNVLNTREEFALLFGTNQSWNAAEAEPLVVTLTERIVLTPHAAKRLLLVLGTRVGEYEQRFGKLEI